MSDEQVPGGEVFLRGVDSLLTGCQVAMRNSLAHVAMWETGNRPRPPELHKTKLEMESVVANLEDGRALVNQLLQGDSDEALSSHSSETGLQARGRDGESVANPSVRADLLTALSDLDRGLSGLQRGLRTAAGLVGPLSLGIRDSFRKTCS